MIILALARLVSFDRRKVRIRFVLQLIVIEIALAFFFLHAESGLFIIKYVSGFFESLLKFAAEGTNFVFGGMGEKGLAFIFLGVLCPIIFISALIGILQHWRILPIFIRVIGTLLSKLNGMGKLESFNAVSSLILGQSENFIAYKGVLGDLSSRRLFTMAATAMSTVSLSIVGAYMTMLDARFVVAALILNMFSTFIILSVINPTRPEAEPDIKLEKLHESQSFFEMLGEYILAGFKVAMIILAMLIGFIALISAVNALFSSIFGMSFQQILGYVFYPLAWLIGIPLSDALNAGSIMATKLVANEFVAMIELQKLPIKCHLAGWVFCPCSRCRSLTLLPLALWRGNKRSERAAGQRGVAVWFASGVRRDAGEPAFGELCGVGVVSFVRLMPGGAACTGLRYYNGGISRRFSLKLHAHRLVNPHHRLLREA